MGVKDAASVVLIDTCTNSATEVHPDYDQPAACTPSLFTRSYVSHNPEKMLDVDSILKGKYPAKAHARRVADYLQARGHSRDGVIYLEAQRTRMIEDNDEPVPFRQRRPFFYLSGCNLPDAHLTYNIPQDILTLFIPPIDPDSVVWTGLPLSVEEALKMYDVDEVKYTSEVNAALAAYQRSNSTTVYAIPEQVSSHITFLPFAKAVVDSSLKTAIEDTRVVKDEYEAALLAKANQISTLAHNAVVKQSPTAKNEKELWGTFIATCIANGATEQSYHSIVASGTAAATLHYQPNNAPLEGKLNILLDAGGEYECYCADITRTFPINGKFSPESATIYKIVLEMQEKCFAMLKAGVMWESVHETAHRVAIDGLLECGVLKGNAKEIFDKRISTAFFPHGLGHMLGMDTHDTGGNPNYEDEDPMFRYLRIRGKLAEGAVVTVEPGVYFCKFIIDPFLGDAEKSKYIDKDVLERYWEVGGCRIEDNCWITKDGFQNLTDTPKFKL